MHLVRIIRKEASLLERETTVLSYLDLINLSGTIMKFVTIFATLLCASLLLSGLAAATIPTPVDGRITDAVTEDHLSGFHTNNLSAIGAWNDGIWKNSENLACKEINGRTICYQSRQVYGPGAPVSMVSSADVPDTLLSLLTALRGGTVEV